MNKTTVLHMIIGMVIGIAIIILAIIIKNKTSDLYKKGVLSGQRQVAAAIVQAANTSKQAVLNIDGVSYVIKKVDMTKNTPLPIPVKDANEVSPK